MAAAAVTGNDTASASYVIIETTGDALVERGNCDIVIKNSVIKARRGAVSNGTGTIYLTNTTIEATDTGVLVAAPGDISITGGSVTSGGDGARIESSGSIQLNTTTVTGTPNAIVNRGSGTVTIKDSTINGKLQPELRRINGR